MRLIVARCAVDCTGRLTAHLPEALRLIMVKADGSVRQDRRGADGAICPAGAVSQVINRDALESFTAPNQQIRPQSTCLPGEQIIGGSVNIIPHGRGVVQVSRPAAQATFSWSTPSARPGRRTASRERSRGCRSGPARGAGRFPCIRAAPTTAGEP